MDVTKGPVTGPQMQYLLGQGFNLGMTFEADLRSREASRIQPLLKAYRDKGFKHVRVPVTWSMASGKTRLEDAVFMKQLKDTVSYAIHTLKMRVIVDVHHDAWLNSYADTPAMRGKFWALWQKIATTFKDEPQDMLLFQVKNEPNYVFNLSAALTRAMLKVGFDGIRSVSKDRIVLLSPNQQGNCYAAPGVWKTVADLPMAGKDEYMMISPHSYDDWRWCGQDASGVGFDNASIEAMCERAVGTYATFAGRFNMVGHVFTEYGTGRTVASRLDDPRVKHYYYSFTKSAKKHAIPCCAWDDQGWYQLTDSKGHFVHGLADSIMAAL